MKTKGITIWEKHAEKFVLALAFVAAGAFTAMQFIGEPNAVSTSVGDVGPGEIDELLQNRAEELLAKLRDDAPAGVELPYPTLGFDDLLAQRDLSLSPAVTLPPFQIALAPSIVGVGLGKSLELPVPTMTAPDQVAVGQYADALAEGVVDHYEELQELFDPGEPHDMVFATVRARFDLAELRRQLRGDDAAADEAIIPSSWYNDRPEHLVDVIVEREELEDGAWTNLRTIDPIPGQFSFRKQLEGELFAALRDEVLGHLSDPASQFAVIQPAFYPTKSADWSVPIWDEEDPNAIDDDAARIRKLNAKRKQHYAERERQLDDLADAGGSLDEEEDEERGGRAPAGGGLGGGGRRDAPGGGKRGAPGSGSGGFGGAPGGGSGKRTGGGEQSGKANERLIKSIKQNIIRVDRRIAIVERDLRELGVDLDAEEIIADPFAAIDEDEILVWGHDLSVEPGKTYRYRVTVSVYNPFFGKKRSLVEKQQALAEVFTLNSPASEWSPAVRIHPLRRVFITNASATGGQRGLGRATAEVYRFYDGIQWVHSFYVQPGRAIGGVEEVKRPGGDGATMQVDFTTSLFVLDIVEEIDTGRNDAGRQDIIRGQARVLLRDLDEPRIVEMRDPRIEEKDPERQRLRDKLPAPEPRRS